MNNSDFSKFETLVTRIHLKAKEKGYTISGIEKALRFGNGTVGKWRASSPSLENIEKVAVFLGVQIDYLLGRTEDDRPPMKERYPDESFDVSFADLSDEAIKAAALWDLLDEPGKAIILGDIYRRLEMTKNCEGKME